MEWSVQPWDRLAMSFKCKLMNWSGDMCGRVSVCVCVCVGEGVSVFVFNILPINIFLFI